jgi:hypothetical protein
MEGQTQESAETYFTTYMDDSDHADTKYLVAWEDTYVMGILNALKGENIDEDYKAEFLEGEPVVATCGGSQAIADVLKTPNENSFGKLQVVAYSADLLNGPVSADSSKAGAMVKTEVGFGSRNATVSFEGAFAINYYFAPNSYVDSHIIFYYWTADDYAAASMLSPANATGKMTMQVNSDGTYWAQISGIAAKQLDDTFYVAAVYTSDLETRCTGVIAYSLSKYCMNNANHPLMAEFAKATAVYGHHAKQYFS